MSETKTTRKQLPAYLILALIALAAALLLAVKAVFRDKLSPRWQAAAWGVLGLVLLVPALEPLFAVAPLSIGMVGSIVGLAFGSMLVIQLLKWIRR